MMGGKETYKNLRVLLVDDDTFALRIIRHIVYGFGVVNVYEVFDGQNVIYQMEKHKIDLLITDVEMPHINGLELLKRVRCGKTPTPRNLPVIIVTSLSNTEVLRTSVALDINGFLVKPLKPITVQEKLHDAVTEANAGTIVCHPESHYENVVTELNPNKTKKEEKTAVNAGILIDKDKNKVEEQATQHSHGQKVPIRDLKPGMVIETDMYFKDGTLLLSSGHTLTENTINRLMDLREVLNTEFCLVRYELAQDEAKQEELKKAAK